MPLPLPSRWTKSHFAYATYVFCSCFVLWLTRFICPLAIPRIGRFITQWIHERQLPPTKYRAEKTLKSVCTLHHTNTHTHTLSEHTFLFGVVCFGSNFRGLSQKHIQLMVLPQTHRRPKKFQLGDLGLHNTDSGCFVITCEQVFSVSIYLSLSHCP